MTREMVGFIMCARSNQTELVRDLRMFWKVLTDFDSRNVGRDRQIRTSNLRGSIGLQIVSFQVTWSTMNEQQNDGGVGASRTGRGAPVSINRPMRVRRSTKNRLAKNRVVTDDAQRSPRSMEHLTPVLNSKRSSSALSSCLQIVLNEVHRCGVGFGNDLRFDTGQSVLATWQREQSMFDFMLFKFPRHQR